ncbi:SIMPL domain-containing protein [Duganella sp. sic0402]|uniref:SIMPL domain-containing protein n=1 Tax=Duganella sp. sic0402 TaxID=2854786 RepID=UPI001C43DC2C|nr:SIMPL domain-containing protein [Duganella sp. sic0402]MBV7535486.1 SIMPL domain-containing protein [Duganella sp. sic0402]
MHIMKKLAAAAAVSFALGAHAAPTESLPTTGTLVVVPAYGEVKHANDQAVVTLAVEEQDKDKAAAASRVNQKMKQGLEIVKKEDPSASLKTQGYYTYPVYPEERVLPNGQPVKQRVPTAWRVGQYLEVTTTNLDKLPKTVAAAQKILTLNNINFGLTPETTRKLDDQRIAATYKNLNERIGSIANAMGRKVGDAVIDTIDFEGSGNYTESRPAAAPMIMMRAKAADMAEVAEPSFEPGETTLQMQVVGKVRFK